MKRRASSAYRDRRSTSWSALAVSPMSASATVPCGSRGRISNSGSRRTPMGLAETDSAGSGCRRQGGVRLLEAEGFRDSISGVPTVDEGEVAPRRRQVGVAHPLHDLARVGVANDRAAEGVAQVVEPEVLAEVRYSQGGAVAVLQRLVSEVLAPVGAEDEIGVSGEVF